MAYVRVEHPRKHVALLTLNRPDRLNALSFQLLRDLHGALTEFDNDLATRVVVITGAGRGFCAGLDLKAVVSGENGPWEDGLGRIQDTLRMQEAFAGIVLRMRRIPQPLVAAVNGAAAGGGLAIAAACDLRLCAPSARFNAAFARLGLGGADMGTSYFLPKAVGPAMAAEMMYTGRLVEADEALRIGLVSRIVEADALVDATLDLAESMVQSASPLGLRITKDALNLAQGGLSLEQVLAVENRNQALALQTDDLQEGMLAWFEKRPPAYGDR